VALHTLEAARYSAKGVDILAGLVMVVSTFAVLVMMAGTLAGSAADTL